MRSTSHRRRKRNAEVKPFRDALKLRVGLYLARPSSYDLEAFWALTGRRFPEQDEVDVEIRKLLEAGWVKV